LDFDIIRLQSKQLTLKCLVNDLSKQVNRANSIPALIKTEQALSRPKYFQTSHKLFLYAIMKCKSKSVKIIEMSDQHLESQNTEQVLLRVDKYK